jgi:hypothetical protein
MDLYYNILQENNINNLSFIREKIKEEFYYELTKLNNYKLYSNELELYR